MNIKNKLAVLSVVVSSIICSSTFAAENNPLPALTVNGGKVTFNGEITLELVQFLDQILTKLLL
ncbi:hypothetical protein AB6G80_19525 [Providencia hangzhouensis]